MNPANDRRDRLSKLTDLPNVGSAMARDLELIGIESPSQLVGKDPLELYESLCRERRGRQDPCVLDVFISITRFMDGDEPKLWWAYTEERKKRHGSSGRIDLRRGT
jgi:hypothetical protein